MDVNNWNRVTKIQNIFNNNSNNNNYNNNNNNNNIVLKF